MSGTLVDTVDIAAASGANGILYEGAFDLLPLAEYRFILKDDSGPIIASVFSVTAASGVFSAADDARVTRANTETLVGRVTSAVTTLWANLTAMITGSGASAAFTETALANAPAGGGGGAGDATLENQTTMLSRLATILTQTGLITAGQLQVVSPVSLGGDLTLYVGDDYAGAHAISLPVSDAGEVLKTYLESCSSVIFGAGKDSAANQIIGTIDKTAITHIAGTNTTYLPLTVTAITTRPGEGFIYAVKGIDDDGEHTKVIGCLKLEAERAQLVET